MEFRLDKKRLLTSLALTALFNTIIALFLTHMGFGGGFTINFIFSQSIGLCICSFILAGHLLVKRPSLPGHAILLLITMPAGTAAGTFIGSQIAGISFSGILGERQPLFIQMLFVGVLFGTMITYFFFSREKISQTEAQLQEEQIRSLTLEKKTLEAHLKLLQAQIEPHFLFNTLSNILSLLDTDPGRGKTMLADLTRYLRSSLSRTRERTATLGQEMDLVRAYLQIHKVRMGERLRYAIEIPEALRNVSLPPMLIQPLVENAIKHGLEPRIEGGDIFVKAEDTADGYCLVVADTGLGLSAESIAGVGLTNVRARLQALFNGKARLILEENPPSGLKATLEIPHE
jgi:sensor histidine kinase YesM